MTQITSMESGTRIGWNIDVGRNSSDGIPTRNIEIFVLFVKVKISSRTGSRHGMVQQKVNLKTVETIKFRK